MTLRRQSGRFDDLGQNIRQALCERVADRGPNSRTWERIRARAEVESVPGKGVSAFLRSVGVWLSADAGPALWFADRRDLIGAWQYDSAWVHRRSVHLAAGSAF